MNQSPTTSVPGCANCLRLEREVYQLQQRLDELERRMNRNSGNSSVPPSAHPPWAPQRGLCWSHLKGDFQELAEQEGATQQMGQEGLSICAAVFEAWGRFRDKQISRSILQKQIQGVSRGMRKLLKRGRRCRSKPTAGFCAELLRLEPALWTFARVAGIEPTNNHAERMLRPAVMWRKQSLGSHSIAGCRFVERMMTVLQTLKLRSRPAMDYLEQAIHAFRHGLSPPSLLT